MSYISSLNLLGDDSPIPISEEALSEELELWANAQFTFDTAPGSALPDDSYKAAAEQQELLATIASFNEQSMLQLLTEKSNELQFNLPKLAPAPAQKMAIQPLTKAEPPKKRKSIASVKDDDSAEDDKRKRNTAASARFRMKKKLREQALEITAKEMTLKAEALEKRVQELEKEAKWLRALIVEKDPSLLK